MKVVVISPSKIKENEINNIIKMFEAGLDCYHLRKPKFSTKQLQEYIEKIPKQFHNRIITHSHHNLARKYNLQGVHYTKKHLEKNLKNWWREKMLRISTSNFIKTSSHGKLASLYEDEEGMKFDYVFLSPIFDTITGKYQSGYYEDSIKLALQKTGKKVIARGGVDVTRIEKIKELGFYGMALYSSVWDKENPVEEYLKVIQRCKELDIPVE
ncbi:MAG TPA: thiamine phosphate synthase [Bacteroidia bacterium]|jgi:thiamine-phosphate pyrophosphorylase|nr:thiamine phosphate synthase [Bacteroidia bacterium]